MVAAASFPGGRPERRAVLVSSKARAAGVESFDGREAIRKAKEANAGVGLTKVEQKELGFYWGGYEASIGVTSLHGAIVDKLLRAPPRDLREAVIAELEYLSKHTQTDVLLERVSTNWDTTRHEVRRTLNGLVESGFIAQDVRQTECTKEEDDGTKRKYVGPVQWCHSIKRLDGTPPIRRTREERWAHDDQLREREARGWQKCKDSPPAYNATPHGAPTRKHDRVHEAVQSLDVRTRVILERLYGFSARAPYVDVFGPDRARVVEFTDAVEVRRVDLVAIRLREQLGALDRSRAEMIRNLEEAPSRLKKLEAKVNPTPFDQHRMARQRGIIRAGMPGMHQDKDVLRRVDKGTTWYDVLRVWLDEQPDGKDARAEWSRHREKFVGDARRECNTIIKSVANAYRAARGFFVPEE